MKNALLWSALEQFSRFDVPRRFSRRGFSSRKSRKIKSWSLYTYGKIALSAALFAGGIAATAQSMPVSVEGYWKLTKMYPKKPRATPGCMANPAFFSKFGRGTRVLVKDKSIVWGTSSATDPGPQLSMMEPADFSAQHSAAGVTLHDLEMDRMAKIQTIQLGAPGTLPFDTIVVRDPSVVYFERCGLFMEAVHDSGFVAPPLPNQQ